MTDAGADAKVDGAAVELDAAGTADDEEVSFGSTKPEVWAVAPAATGSTICCWSDVLLIVGMYDKIE